MSLKEYLVIHFSKAVAEASPEVKRASLMLLKDYVHEHSDVWVGYDGIDLSIDEVIEPYFNGEITDLTRTSFQEIADIRIERHHKQPIEGLGFSLRKPGFSVFAM